MRQTFITQTLNFIRSNNPEMTEEQIEKLHYGLESLYIIITKFSLLFLITLFLGILKEFIIILVFFNLLRYFAFGFHAGSSLLCFILSTLLFVGLPYLMLQIDFSPEFLFVIVAISILCFLVFAPADTEKRPLTNTRKRHIRKVISVISALVYGIVILLFPHTEIARYLLIALVLETIAIMPTTYWLFGQSYANYRIQDLNRNV